VCVRERNTHKIFTGKHTCCHNTPENIFLRKCRYELTSIVMNNWVFVSFSLELSEYIVRIKFCLRWELMNVWDVDSLILYVKKWLLLVMNHEIFVAVGIYVQGLSLFGYNLLSLRDNQFCSVFKKICSKMFHLY
jgi:hypothetical protein